MVLLLSEGQKVLVVNAEPPSNVVGSRPRRNARSAGIATTSTRRGVKREGSLSPEQQFRGRSLRVQVHGVILGLLGGVPGAFFRPLAVTMSVALLVSLLLALSFTPALAASLEAGDERRATERPGDRLARWLARFYTRGLRWALDHPPIALR